NAVRVMMRANDDNNYMILIEDDGIGIQSKVIDDHPGEHLGLKIMQERAARIGGDLKIESDSGEGTRIILGFSQHNSKATPGHTVEVESPAHSVS
ncbi:MAG TPA: hypothetical protein ENI74_04585, partial [Gammaproteobacteria bacterium]|nr:hypothetical protein [Gammaproteobacteria bacterium]